MTDADTSKAEFLAAWPGGYVENFGAYPKGAEYDVLGVLAPFFDSNAHCLELGPGGGLWTMKYLVRFFGQLTCIDVLPKPMALRQLKVKWIEVGDRDFSCTGVPDASIDFVFSFGLFCHLTAGAQSDYLHSLYRVMRPGAHGLIAFANWKRHPSIKRDPANERFAHERHASGTCWFYSDENFAKMLVLEAGFVDFKDALPLFRDTLATFRKP